MDLRTRDIFALLAAILVTRLAWNSDTILLEAHLRLAWYVPLSHSAEPTTAVVDVDGDGIADALSIWTHDNNNEWTLQVLKIGASTRSSSSNSGGMPFRPSVALQAPGLTSESVTTSPLSLAAGHVRLLEDTVADTSTLNNNDRSRQYFCGIDWHHAAATCGHACPGGTSGECPDDQRCFADTGCDAVRAESSSSFTTHPVPAMATLWRDGTVSLHGIMPSLNDTTTLLHLSLLWQVKPFVNTTSIDYWDAYDVQLIDSIHAGNAAGLVVVTGTVTLTGMDDETSIAVALHGKTGHTVWSTTWSEGETKNPTTQMLLPLQRGSSSAARRRSWNPTLPQHQGPQAVEALHNNNNKKRRLLPVTNCWHAYRRSILTNVVPWTSSNIDFWQQSLLVHVDHQHKSQLHTHPRDKSANKKRSKPPPPQQPWWSNSWMSWTSSRKVAAAATPHYGRPNAVVSPTRTGLQVRSLRNGQALCSMDLWSDALYVDLNHDATLNTVTILRGPQYLGGDDDTRQQRQWVARLVERLRGQLDTKNVSSKAGQSDEAHIHTPLCHLQVLSGVPTKEELFSVDVCGSQQRHSDPFAAPPLAVERIKGKGWDIIAGVSSGVVTRIDGFTGRRMWQWEGAKRLTNPPTWEDDMSYLLSRIQIPHVPPAVRPIVFAGENGVVLLSARHGELLAETKFPQMSQSRPLLVDLNGDGVSDLLVHTPDALWAYEVRIRTGGALMMRLLTGFVLLGMMLALLRNRYGPTPGKRSTDP